MNRGDIYWVNLSSSKGKGSEINKERPCVLVGATPINKARRTVVVVPLSTAAQARPPITISVSCLGKEVMAVCDQIRAIDKSRIKKAVGSLSLKDLKALDNGLREVLNLG
jgi:mRNA interferase MazF